MYSKLVGSPIKSVRPVELLIDNKTNLIIDLVIKILIKMIKAKSSQKITFLLHKYRKYLNRVRIYASQK